MPEKLSEKEVLARLYSPTRNLQNPPGNKALVIISHGVENSATPAEIENLTRKAFFHFKELGIEPGDNVVFCCENRLEYSPALLACWALKARTTLIDYRTEPTQLFEVCEKLKVKALFTSIPIADLPAQESKFKISQVNEIDRVKEHDCKNPIDFSDLDLDSPLLALFTSGTTGAPKTAVHDLRSFFQNLTDLAYMVDLPQGLTGVTPLPVSHIFGLTVMLITQILGMKTVLTSLDPVAFIKAVHYHKPQLIAALPQFYGALLSAPIGIIKLDEAKLLLSGGAPLTVSLSRKFEETFGKRLNNGYGSTESKIFALNQDGPALSVGKAVPGVLIEVIDAQGQTLPDGKSGEIRITSSTLMKEYLHNDEKTKKVLVGNQYFTGDYGYLENEYLYVAGRKDDIVTVAGVVVHAAEIEAALRNFEQVKDVAVTPLANKRLGQIIKASVVLMDDKKASGLTSTDPVKRAETTLAFARQFKEYCTQHLSRYKRPMKWEFLGPHDDLPKTLAGKVDKKALSTR